jgi:phosphatidate cytidylyltransferase
MAKGSELKTRLWMGALLIGLVVGVLFFDPGPWYPFLLTFLVLLASGACYELRQLLEPGQRPPLWLTWPGVLAVLAANWTPLLFGGDVWGHLAGIFAGVVLLAFCVEMARFRGPSGAVARIGLAIGTVAYLGLLPAFLAQLRWWPALPEGAGPDRRGAAALALTIFVPKFCDIGAYFTGKLLGRHKMSPVISPGKTYEGLAGGLALSAVVALLLNRWVPLLPGDLPALGFGVSVGLAGVIGDLAESLIKRDCQKKDASAVVPGFGGVLDLIDSILFAAPVAYLWLRVLTP